MYYIVYLIETETDNNVAIGVLNDLDDDLKATVRRLGLADGDFAIFSGAILKSFADRQVRR